MTDNVYRDMNQNCGRPYTPNTSSPGDSVDMDDCGMEPLPLHAHVADSIQWEHVVPASLMSANQMSGWLNPEQFDACTDDNGNVTETKRDCCE